jgi:hypothetical protein
VTVHVWSDERLNELRQLGDPDADSVVAAYLAERSSIRPQDLIGHLVRHEHMAVEERSPAVEDYLREQPPLPSWADGGEIRAAEDFFLEWGLLISLMHYYASLPSMYAFGRGVKVLHLTARLATDTKRRIHETGQLIVNVMTPGGLDVGSTGYLSARRVRLMHAAVRHLILHEPSVAQTCDPSATGPLWCSDWGVPINQEDLLGTLMSFSWVVFESLARAGVRVSEADAASYLHAWNVVGFLLGIREDLLPVDLAGAPRLWAAITRRQFAASYDGAEMTSALLRLLQHSMPAALHGLAPAQLRYFAGDEVANILGLKRAGAWETALGGARRAMGFVASVEQHDRLLRLVSRKLGRLVFKAFLESDRSGNRSPFTIPTHLAAHWNVPASPSLSASTAPP